MKCIDCTHRGVCKFVEEDFRKLEKAEQWASQKIEIMEEKEACDFYEKDVVHAKWKILENDYAYDDMFTYECSNCLSELCMTSDAFAPYCPNCGAKMDKE